MTSKENIGNDNPKIIETRDIITRNSENVKVPGSADKFYNIFNSSPYPIMFIDVITGHFSDINDAFAKNIGFDKEYLVGKSAVELGVISGDVENVTRKLIMENGRFSDLEVSIKTKSGDKRIGLIAGQIIEVDGRPYVMQTIIDITERKHAEEKLRETTEMFKQTFDTNPDAININRLSDGMYISVNKGFSKIIGYEEEEIVGHTSTECDIWANREDRKILVEKLISEGCINDFETSFKCKNGEIKYGSMSANIIMIDGVKHITSTTKDITERKLNEEKLQKSESKLRENEEKLNTMISNISDVIGIIGVDGKMRDTSSNLEKFFGWSPKEVEGTSVWSRVHPDDIEDLQKKFETFIKNKNTTMSVELRYLCKDGSYKIIELTGNNLIGKENIDGILVNYRDVTENRQLKMYDSLTGLFRREYAEEELKKIDKYNKLPLGVLMADLDGLKGINDKFGRASGDRLLKIVAEMMQGVVKEGCIVSRWGGDEIVIFIPKTSEKEISGLIAKIENESKKYINQGTPLHLSIGTSIKINVLQDITEVIVEAENFMNRQKLRQGGSMRSSVVEILGGILHEKNEETEEHTDRVKDYALKLGLHIGLPSHEMDKLSILAALHDIGKVAIDQNILNKSDKLTDDEWEIMKTHTRIGANIASKNSQINHLSVDILACHERWDGNGYPNRLSGENIPFLARIVFIVDSYDVMTHKRSYKKPMTKYEAINELKRCSGTQFDPNLVEKFIQIIEMEK